MTNLTALYLMCIITLQPLKKAITVYHEIYSCEILGDIRPNCPFVLIGDHVWKLTNVTFMKLLCFTMQNVFKNTCSQLRDTRLYTFVSNWDGIAHLHPKRTFLAKMINVSFVKLLQLMKSKHSKKILTDNHEV